jgi:hypothetical protein
MLRRSGVLLTVCGGLLVAAWSFHASASGGDDEKKPAPKKNEAADKPSIKKVAMKTFMRKKLEASQSVLEGLAVEDFDLITAGARQLKTMTAAAEFMVIHDPIYTQQADEFRRIIDKLEKAAKEKRLDGATLAYVDMTMSCVECHKFVRNVQIAKD